MPSVMRRVGVLFATLWLAWGLNAQAAGVSPDDAQQIRAVVEAQLAAFAADDAERAYALAAPNVRRMFPSVGAFMAMVRGGYPVVYRPASVSFLKPERHDDDVIQSVQMSDARGDLWLAVYRLQRQPDQSWRISGCDIERNEGRAT